jgi:hypothetical protein
MREKVSSKCHLHLQDLLGHRSLATTARCLRLTITGLKEAQAQFHPREKQSQQFSQ